MAKGTESMDNEVLLRAAELTEELINADAFALICIVSYLEKRRKCFWMAKLL